MSNHEERHRAIFNQHFQHMVLLTPEGRVTEINDLPLELGNLNRDQIVGRLIWETPWWRSLPQSPADWQTILDESASATTPLQRDIRFQPADGRALRDFECTITAVRLPDGTLDCFVVQGVTERGRYTSLLQASEDRLAALVEVSPVPHLVTNADNTVALVNPAFVRSFGYSADDIREPGEWWARATPDPAYRDVVVSAWNGLLRGTPGRDLAPQHIEIKIHTKDDRIRTALVAGSSLDGSPSGRRLMVLYDITDRKAAEEELATNTALLQIAGRAARLGAWSLDLRDRSIRWSDEACAIHGMPQGTVPSEQEVVEFYLPEHRPRFGAAVAECAKSGAPFDIECEGVTAQGIPLWVRAIAHAERDQSGLVRRIHGAVQDITADKRAELELFQTNRALKMHSACTEAMIRARDEDSMLQAICEIAVETGGYKIARIRYAQDDEARSLMVRAQAGERFPFLDRLPASWSADTRAGHGPLGDAVRSGDATVIADLAELPALQFMADEIRAARLGDTTILPLANDERTFGTIGLSAPEGVRIGAQERRLLEDLAEGVAFGIASIRARSERDQATAALRTSLHEKEGLLKEIHHRVKNNLQVVTSLLRLESNRINMPETTTVLRGMQNRIQSMALLHEALYRSGSFARVDLAGYLRQLTSHVSRSLVNGARIEFRLDLAPIEVEVDQAVPCGLIVNEVVTNAVKYAFPDGRAGSIWIELQPVEGGAIRLTVRDDGVGVPADFDVRRSKSLGLQLVSDLTTQLRGKLAITSNPGACFEVTFTPAEPHSTAEMSRPHA